MKEHSEFSNCAWFHRYFPRQENHNESNKYLKVKRNLLASLAALCLLVSCSDDGVLPNSVSLTSGASVSYSEEETTEESLTSFARILSTASFERKDLRVFLKEEALKKFDKNYDILYLAVKDEMVGDKTFRQILASYSSENTIDSIEANVPLLNIYLTRTAFLDIYPEELDVDDKFTPIAVSVKDSVEFFCGGKKEFCLSKGEVPDCHVFVVGENSRVVVKGANAGNKSLSSRGFEFIDEAFDGTVSEEAALKSVEVSSSNIGQRALDSYRYFYSDGNDVHQKGLQRDYIYHGLTPQNTKGKLVNSVSEYIGTIRVPIAAMYSFADDRTTDGTYADPYILTTEVDKKGAGLGYEELMNKVWAKGAFNFMFEVITSNQTIAGVTYVSLTPDDLWTMSYTHTRKHKTWFHRSRHTYVINVDKFESKDVILKKPVNMGKWNIAQESIYRYVKIKEFDKGREISTKMTYEMDKMKSSSFSGDYKLTLGLGKDNGTHASGSADWNTKSDNTNTVKVTKEITEKWTEESDDLGLVQIYYYDPVIESMNGSSPILRTYSTGSVEFGIFVK